MLHYLILELHTLFK